MNCIISCVVIEISSAKVEGLWNMRNSVVVRTVSSQAEMSNCETERLSVSAVIDRRPVQGVLCLSSSDCWEFVWNIVDLIDLRSITSCVSIQEIYIRLKSSCHEWAWITVQTFSSIFTFIIENQMPFEDRKLNHHVVCHVKASFTTWSILPLWEKDMLINMVYLKMNNYLVGVFFTFSLDFLFFQFIMS